MCCHLRAGVMVIRDAHYDYTRIYVYTQLGEGGCISRLTESRHRLTEIAGVGYTCSYRLLDVLMSGLCLYDILTNLLYVQNALLVVSGLSSVVKRIRGAGTAMLSEVYVWRYVLVHMQCVLVRYEGMSRWYDIVIGCVLAVWLMVVLTVALMRMLDRGVDRPDRQLLGEVEGYGDM